MSVNFYKNSNHTVCIDSLRDFCDETIYLNTATITAVFRTSAGVDMGTPVAVTYTAASDGDYKGTILHTNGPDDFVVGTTYQLHVTITQTGPDYYEERLTEGRAEWHGATP